MPSITKCIQLNMFFISLGYLYYMVYVYSNLYVLYAFTIIKNASLLYITHSFTKSYPHIKNKENSMVIQKIDIYNCFLVSSVDMLGICFCQKHNGNHILIDIALYIPTAFAFEVLFDLFHYITHRAAHTKYIYKYIHKRHHEYHEDTTVMATFHQDPVDLLLTNFLPMYITSHIVTFSYPQYFIFLGYKTFNEIGGHLGKNVNSCSFTPFIWLPKWFHIELHSIDHYHHHTKNNCNYSKRFSLWDKVLGTFYSSHSSNKNNKI